MDIKSTRNLGLTALVGLFAVYGFTAHNLRLGSISSSGITIKYSKRGLASVIKCPRTQNTIDETAADRFSEDEECVHHVSPKTLENGDMEYTVTTYYKGFTSAGTKIYPADVAAEKADHNKDFIVELVRKSKAKFDESSPTTPNVELAQAGLVEDTIQEADAIPPIDPRTPIAAESLMKANVDGRPAITAPSSISPNDTELSSTEETSLDAEVLMQAIEQYAELKVSYNSCQTDTSENRDIKSLIDKYDSGILKYVEKVEKFESSNNDNESIPFVKLRSRDKEKLEDFVAKINQMDSSLGGENENSSAMDSSDPYTCLLDRAKDIKGKEAKFNHYVQNIQPLLRQELRTDNPAHFDKITKALNDGSGPIAALASGNEHIRGSIQADYFGAKANLLHSENNKLKIQAQDLNEPLKSQKLHQIKVKGDQIDSNLALSLSNLKAANPLLAGHLESGSQFWTQQIAPLQPIDTSLPVSTTADPSSINPHNSRADLMAGQQLTVLRAMFMKLSGSGNSRNQPVRDTGARNKETQEFRGQGVPQLNDQVGGARAIQ